MIHALLPFAVLISALALPAPLLDEPSVVPADAATLVVVDGPLADDAVALLTRHLDYYGDFGTLALGEGTSDDVAALTDRGLSAVRLDAWPGDAVLFVAPLGESADHAGAVVLYANGHQELYAVPAGAEDDDHASHACLGHARAPVVRDAWAPARTFVAPAAARGGSSLTGEAATQPGSDPLAGTITVDPRIAPLLDNVSENAISDTVAQLSTYFTRRTTSTEIFDAADDIIAELQAIPGLDVSTQVINPTWGPNIIAEKTGTLAPNRVLVVGAHYDSINNFDTEGAAPGADDNASGVGGILEVARALSETQYESTIRFVLFSAEEFQLIGSDVYVDALVEEGVDTFAMLNMDMISHLEPGDDFDVDFPTNGTDPALVQFCQDITAAYVPSLPTTTGILTAGTSDHWSFQSAGIPAVFFFEDITEFSQVIHTEDDVLGTSANDFMLAAQIAKAFTAATATLAVPVDMLLTHAPLADTTDAGGPYAVSVDVESVIGSTVEEVDLNWRLDGGPWQTTAMLKGNGADDWVASIPGVAGDGIVEYWFESRDDADWDQWHPWAPERGQLSFQFAVGAFAEDFHADFEDPALEGWSHVAVAGQDDWQHGTPAGLSLDPFGAFAGSRAWGNDLGLNLFNGEYQPNVVNRFNSPVLDMSGKTGVHLRYQRWLTVEDGLFDQATILVNGTPAWQNPAGSGDLVDIGWKRHDVDISALADDNPSVQITYELATNASNEFGGWTLDEVQVGTVMPGTVDPLLTSALHLSAQQGGVVDFTIDAGAGFGGRKYAVLMGASGSVPATPLGLTSVPLVFDGLTSLLLPLLPALGWIGTLSPEGTASASWFSPPTDPALAGVELTVVAITYQPIDYATNAVSFVYVP